MYIENLKSQNEADQSENITANRRIGQIILHWQAPEYESYERDRRWYTLMALALIAVIAYALFTNSPLMAITFILIGIIEYIYVSREPELLDFAITEKGILAGREIYEFEQINSFWIFYEPSAIKSLSLFTKGKLLPYIHIPLHEENPEEIRDILVKYISEKKQEPRLADTLNRLLRL